MNEFELREKIINELPFLPNPEQLALIQTLTKFLINRYANDVFILNGYAGTGKTSVVGAVIRALSSFKKKTIVLAPTGRAAKVAAFLAEGKATTIHKRLFRGDSTNPNNNTYFLTENKDKNTLFIIDEASLISDGSSLSNSLLLQLIRHVYNGQNCSMILVGDLAQLPPVGQSYSHAMDSERLKQIGLNPLLFTLSQPVRQAFESGVLQNATIVRQALFNNSPLDNFSLIKSGFPDIEVLDPSEFLDTLSSSYSNVGKEETIVITRSNFRANNINNTIRKYLLDAEDPLISGEKLIISKNDYFWSKENKLQNFLANGESVEIIGNAKKIKKYGRWFADVELKISGVEHPFAAKLILRSLVAEGPSIPREEMDRFYNRILIETEGELTEKIKALQLNPYYNALQVKYGYCVTCHKAQGGQWKNVFIDLGGIPQDISENDFYRWLYTAITRASEKIYLLNPSFPID